MKILVNTDNHINSSAGFIAKVEKHVERALRKFSSHITRVEVYFQDENKSKGGKDDKRCTLEIRLEHFDPASVGINAGTLNDALNGALKKAERVVGDLLEKVQEKRTKDQPLEDL